MTTAAAERTDNATQIVKQQQNAPMIGAPRLPFHPLVQERFGVDKASWKALVEAIFPNATSVESVILALSYCRARKLDPFKRNVHIVPIWDKARGCMVDTIWPGIGELRTTAFRTHEYAGREKTDFGPDVKMKVGTLEMTYPEWAQVTVYRMVQGQKVAFSGPQVYWIETYATVKRNDNTPNEMWANRPRGQIDKCAEAAALRAAFPEEVGSDYIPEEIEGRRGSPQVLIETTGGSAESVSQSRSDQFAQQLAGKSGAAQTEGATTDDGTTLQTREPGDDAETETASSAQTIAPPEGGQLSAVGEAFVKKFEAATGDYDKLLALVDEMASVYKPKGKCRDPEGIWLHARLDELIAAAKKK